MQRFGFLEVAMRQNDLAWEIRYYLNAHPNAAVVNLGCGLDNTGHFCNNGKCKIYNLDFPDVITVRKDVYKRQGAEFGIKPSQSDVEFKSLVLSDELQNESKVQTIKDGCLYFGFFSNTNKYSTEKKKIATLNYTYSGSGIRTISLVESKIVIVDKTGKTNGDTSSSPFTVSITRQGTSGGGGGSSSSGGSIKEPDITLSLIHIYCLHRQFRQRAFRAIHHRKHWCQHRHNHMRMGFYR